MSTITLQVRRADLAESRLVEGPLPDISEGQSLVAVEKFALTANNVTYALFGDELGYWKFYPVEEPWGVVPVWGFAVVEASRCPDIPVGERLWGFLPMASHAVLTPARVSPGGFVEASPHRRGLAAAYNAYARTSGDAPGLQAIEDERCILFPLYTTSYLLCDYLTDNAFFGADRVLISSVSSKTALGLARLLRDRGEGRPEIVGLTSPAHVDFVKGLDVCDEVATYDDIDDIAAARPTAYVDMAGRGEATRAVHSRLGANLKASIAVGVTHWDAGRFSNRDAPATPHTFFFAPAQLAKRDGEWGPGEAMRRARAACMTLVRDFAGATSVAREYGAEATRAAFLRLVEGRQPPGIGIMASLTRAG